MLTKWRCATLSAEHPFQTYCASLVNITWLSRAYKDRAILISISIAFLLTRIERESSKIVLAHVQFSPLATLPTFVYGAYVTHVTLDTRLPFPLVQLKKEEPGDEANIDYISLARSHSLYNLHPKRVNDLKLSLRVEGVRF